MFIHDDFDIILKCGISEISSIYENELINYQNDYNVNKQIFICLFATCIVYIGITSKKIYMTGTWNVEGWRCNKT